MKRHEEAIAVIDQGLTVDPENPVLLNNRGWSLARAGRYAEGLISIDESLRLRPENPDTLNSRAYALVGLGRYEDAMVDVDKSLKTGDFAWNYYVRAAALAGEGRYADSLADLTIAVDRAEVMGQEAATSDWFLGLRRDPTFGPRFDRLVVG
jgi:tetratricopeptide (TPR) repeat protein